jgi:hypothetical protein
MFGDGGSVVLMGKIDAKCELTVDISSLKDNKKRMFKKCDTKMWTEFMWSQTETSGGLF